MDNLPLKSKNIEKVSSMAKDKTESYKAEIKRLEFMLSSITEERDRLKNVVKELKERTSLEGGNQLVSGTIAQEFETSLAKKENYVRELESSLFEQKEINGRQHNELTLLNERITNETRRVKMLEREGDRLRSEIALLELKVCVPRQSTRLMDFLLIQRNYDIGKAFLKYDEDYVHVCTE